MLACRLEAAGFSTLLVTMMPFWAEKIGVPRILAVEFPFGTTLGRSLEIEQQMRVIHQALSVLESAEEPGIIVHSMEEWPVPQRQATKYWQSKEPFSIINLLKPRFRELMRQRRD